MMEKYGREDAKFAMLTLTLRHERVDKLDNLVDILMEAWRKTSKSAPWERFTEREGLIGYFRALEVTVGRNGWHPHLHILLILHKDTPTRGLEKRWNEFIGPRWAQKVTSLGGRMPSKERGSHVLLADDEGKVLSDYISKVGGVPKRYSLDKEVTSATRKSGKASGSLHPFQLLDTETFALEGYSATKCRRLWLDYVLALTGRRIMSLTKSLDMTFAQLEAEVSIDEGIANVGSVEQVRLVILGRGWSALISRPGSLTGCLELVETRSAKVASEYLRSEYGVASICYEAGDSEAPEVWSFDPTERRSS